MESYRTVRSFGESRFVEKKSEFIGWTKPCETFEEAQAFRDEARRSFPDARHHVFAFINREGNLQRFDDDGEPKGTGGIPILEVLKKEELTGLCIVVIRYFGGILLGAGPLARAYARSARDAVAAAGVCRFSRVYRGKFSLPYPLFSKAEAALNAGGYRLTDKTFAQNVEISLLISPEEKEKLETFLADLSGGKVSLEITGETYA